MRKILFPLFTMLWLAGSVPAQIEITGTQIVFPDGSVQTNAAGSDLGHGGFNNTVSGDQAFVGGGYNNKALGPRAVVAGGYGNEVTPYSFIGGGLVNKVTAATGYSAVVGGSGNLVTDIYGFVGAGRNNTAGNNTGTDNDASYATVGGGGHNKVSAKFGTIGGGGSDILADGNQVADDWGTVGGGSNNQAGDGDLNAADATLATVGGGEGNTASGHHATVGGGQTNGAVGTLATVAGGQSNTASGYASTVGGGKINSAGPANFATVGGGVLNLASGIYSTVGGGYTNTATGNSATVAGGAFNDAGADYSFAAGRRAKIDPLHLGTFLFADQTNFDFYSAGPNEFAVRANGGVRFVTAVTGITPTAGVSLTSGDTSWNVLSAKETKENYTDIDSVDVLERVAKLPIQRWNYIHQDDAVQHIGPYAKDFYDAFQLHGEYQGTISGQDLDGVALAAIQGLNTKLEQRDAELAELRARLAALEAKVNPSAP